jgi:protein-disulfide isomerase
MRTRVVFVLRSLFGHAPLLFHVVLLALLPLLACACGGEVPVVIRDEIAKTRQMTGELSAEAVTVVFFTDFQCPFCRRTHAALAPLVAARRGRVRVVMKHVPLPRHPDARSAARAAVCVETITRALTDDYASALYQSQDLSEAACEELAVERGVDRARFQRCLAEPSTDARIERDLAMFDAVKGDGVPLLYVGRTRLDGAQSTSSLEAALDEELARR